MAEKLIDLVAVEDMTGGLDRRVGPTLVRKDRARQAHNVRLSIRGSWQPRTTANAGWLQFSTTSLGTDRPQGGQRIYLSGVTPFTLAAEAGDVYLPSDGGVWGAAVLSGLDIDNAVDFPFDATMVAVFDGVTQPKRSIDGTTWVQMGVSAPSVDPTLAAVAGGSLTVGNTYEVSYAYEGDLNAFPGNESGVDTQATAGADLTIRATVAYSTDPQVANILIYARDVTAGETVRRLATTIANSGVGTVDVDLTSNTWFPDGEEPFTTHNVIPATVSAGVVWKNRWWAIDGRAIRFSESFLAQAWPTNYSLDPPFTRGDNPTAIIPFGDSLIVLGTSKQGFVVTGTNQLDFDIRPLTGLEAGAFGFRSWDVFASGLVHAAPEGVFVFNGSSDQQLNDDFDPDWRSMVAQTDVSDLARIAVKYHRRDKELRIAVPNVTIYGQAGEYIFDLQRTQEGNPPAWSTTDRGVGGYLAFDGPEETTGNRGRLFSWSDTDGILNEESSGASANGQDMTCQYEGPAFANGFYRSRFTHVFGQFFPSDGVFSITVNVDGVDVMSAKTIDISGGLSQYDIAEYGSSVYGGFGRRQFAQELPVTAEGIAVKLTATYTGQGNFEWFDYAFRRTRELEIRGI